MATPIASAPRAPLATAAAPPFRLPGEHFAAALTMFVVGALGLVWIAPELAAGLFPLPKVIGVTHLFTLGWITTSILGALYQFLPVALGTPIRSQRIAHITFALYAPAVVVFVVGLVGGYSTVMLAGATALSLALLLFIGNLSATLARARRSDLTWWCLAAAALYLAAALSLGAALAANMRFTILGPERFLVVGVHLHIALAGWVFMVIIGVAHHLLPMFLLSHGMDQRPGRAAALLVGAGVMLLTLMHHVIRSLPIWLPAVLIGAGGVAFLLQAFLFFRHRMRPRLDPGMRLAGAALALLALAIVLAAPALWNGVGAPRLLTTYIAALVLAFSLFVAAHYYKIVPFLVWFHRFGPLAGMRPLPTVAELYDARWANAAAAALFFGVSTMLAGITLGNAAITRTGAILFAAGAVVEAAQMVSVSRRRL